MRLIGLFVQFLMVFQLECEIGQAAPSIEPCPPDSKLIDGDACVCDPSACGKPPCLTELVLTSKGGTEPGSCCPLYACTGCKNDTLIDGKCPCAAGAVINQRGACACVNPEHHLVDGACVCDPLRCPLPQLCDKKSVPVVEEDGCCKKTRCVSCPQDSESTSLNSTAKLGPEDHCVCLPCSRPDCGAAKRVVVVKKGTLLPGNCCALYECRPLAEEKDIDCVVGDIIYENGEEWSTDDQQRCKCGNGISRCGKKEGEEISLQNCWDEAVMYKHNETWLKDRGCTFCTCLDGEPKCISHYCDFKERKIAENESSPCHFDGKIYRHLENVTLIDECKFCTCDNGSMSCSDQSCADKEVAKLFGECRPLFDCNKRCPNGFRINKKGCETCKCNPANQNQLLSKYNITYAELLDLLEDYKKNRSESSTSTSTSTPIPTLIIVRHFANGEEKKPDENLQKIEEDKSCWIIVAALAALTIGIVAGIAGYCTYRNRRQYSITPSRGSYHSVADNNNTIKKNSSIRFENE